MAAPVSRLNIRGVGRAAAGVGRRLSEGLPAVFVAALAAFVLGAILVTVASREPTEPRGWAEFTMGPEACTVDPRQQLHATYCFRITDGVYRVGFTKSLTGGTVLASRGSCCPGRIGASIESDSSVIVVVERRVTRPIRASLLVP
jgi:hypothetical protein